MAQEFERAEPGWEQSSVSQGVDHERAERAVRELLLAIGEDPDREGLRDTPERMARASPRTREPKSFTQRSRVFCA